jgi:hypothetical protein
MFSRGPSIMDALEHRRDLSGRWEWMPSSGIIDLVLAGIIPAGNIMPIAGTPQLGSITAMWQPASVKIALKVSAPRRTQ